MYCSHPIKGTNAPVPRTPNARIRTSPDTQLTACNGPKVYPVCPYGRRLGDPKIVSMTQGALMSEVEFLGNVLQRSLGPR
ncbi:hypothetical protein ElyMa_003711300 [Elysia marginata]|uniref:Uncharacterized protein n=1 Tax=Elysia marginata TaxID=1093978 RepID=A0AAV4F304_9GAST|nr:hypothetical protein ElyMa_003711300 [Elysia marginata]